MRDVHMLHHTQSVTMIDENSALRVNMPQRNDEESGKQPRLSFSPSASVWGQMVEDLYLGRHVTNAVTGHYGGGATFEKHFVPLWKIPFQASTTKFMQSWIEPLANKYAKDRELKSAKKMKCPSARTAEQRADAREVVTELARFACSVRVNRDDPPKHSTFRWAPLVSCLTPKPRPIQEEQFQEGFCRRRWM
jgi:hypothetical protein